MRKASLFSGIGGIDLAAHWAGMETVCFCEREPFPQRVLRKHWPDVPIIDDVHDFTRKELERLGIIGDGRAIDLISAGYPCQPFSVAGQRRGTEDDRHLWPEVKRILSEIRPRWFVGENVAGHVTLGLDDVLTDLGGAGYAAQVFIIPAAAVGASHRRDRVFIVAYTEDIRCNVSSESTTAEQGQKKIVSDTRRTCSSGEILADAPGERCGEAWEYIGRSEEWAAGNSEDVAHASGAGREECNASAVSIGPGHSPRGGDSFGGNRPTQPGMGGSAHELSNWLDGGVNPLDALAEFIAQYPQPALMGQPQHTWEPPRVATGVKNRSARLKALGNAVNPLQIYPIMYAIRVIDDWLRRDAA
jgi:DNA (cytosine-5)-methyltransferase 1